MIRSIINSAAMVALSLFVVLEAGALDLPWQQSGKQADAVEVPKPSLRIPGSDSEMFPRMDVNYVGGQTITLDAITVTVPEGWYRGEKNEELKEEAYLFACVPLGSDKMVCVLRIDYDLNEMVRGAEQIPDFLAVSRKNLEKNGEWKTTPLKIGAHDVQGLRNTDTGNETLILVQYALKTYVPAIYIVLPEKNAALPAEAIAFIAGIKQVTGKSESKR